MTLLILFEGYVEYQLRETAARSLRACQNWREPHRGGTNRKLTYRVMILLI